jgi:hypothetical protein
MITRAPGRSSTHAIVIAVASFALLGGCISPDGAGREAASLVVTSRCEITGAGELASGESADGTVRYETTGAAGTWTDNVPGLGTLESTSLTSLECRLNGAIIGEFSGTGTWNGVGGHQYTVLIQDRGVPGEPTPVPGTATVDTVEATRRYSPTRWEDGVLTYPDAARVTIPATLPVTVGNAGNQWTWLTFTLHHTAEPIRCRYRGGASRPNPTSPSDIAAGLEYELFQCERLVERRGCDTWERDASIVAGGVLDVTEVELHVHSGSSRFPSRHHAQTTVTLDLDVTPYVLSTVETDAYRVSIWSPDGTLVHHADGDLATGDFTISVLP